MNGTDAGGMARGRLAAPAALLAGVVVTALVANAAVAAPWVPVAMLVITFAAAGTVAALGRGGRPVPAAKPVDRAGRSAPAERKAESAPAERKAESAPVGSPRFEVRVRGVSRFVRAEDVHWFEARGNYARLHLSDGDHLYRSALSHLERVLDSGRFVRIHKSTIVNVESVRRIRRLRAGDARLELLSGDVVRMSRRYAKAFTEAMARRTVQPG